MADVVCAMGMTHNPRIFYTTTPPSDKERQRVFNVFSTLKSIKDETRPDVLLVVGNHHLTTFLETIPAFSIGVSEWAQGPTSFEIEAGIPPYRCRVDYEFAEFILKNCITNDFDLARSSKYVLDHAFTIPLVFISPKMDTPLIPIITNVHLQPIPNPRRFFELGKVIARAIRDYDAIQHVGIVASFNLSLNVGNSKMGTYDKDFDAYVVDGIRNGKLEELVLQLDRSKLASAGNATFEVLNLFTLFGVIGDKKPTICFNDVVKGWGTISAVAWKLF